MTEQFLHGVRVVEVNSGARTVRNTSSSVIGIIGTAPEADVEMFPLNKPVLITGSSSEAAKLGNIGTLQSAIEGILNQVGAIIVVIRVEEGEDEEAALLNVIGDINIDGSYTGIQAFLASQSNLGVIPRILIAPGFCDQAVITAMIPIAERLRGIIVADAPNTSDAEAVTFATACSNQRVYVVYPEVINAKGDSVSASPYVAGVIARTDNENGFWCSPSNKIVNGIVGLSKPIDYSFGDSACKANYLNENNVATIINQDGFRLWGNHTTSNDSSYKFLCVRRTADIISDSILRAHLWAVDRNIVKNYLTDVTESVNAFMAKLKSRGAILYGKCFANKELNTATNIADGKVYFNFEFTPAYPAEQVTFRAYLSNDNIESVIFENLAQ